MSNMKKSIDRSEINRLITEGKERGYLTYGEINDALPPNIVAPGQIDDLIHLFGENEIHIVDSVKKGEKLISEREETRKGKKTSDKDGPSTSRGESISIDDPVRMYLREMGTISLLTREGEVVIAKKIESGENETLSAVANCPITISQITALGTQVKDGTLSIFDIVLVNEPEDKKPELEKSEKKNFIKNIRHLNSQEKKLRKNPKKPYLEADGENALKTRKRGSQSKRTLRRVHSKNKPKSRYHKRNY